MLYEPWSDSEETFAYVLANLCVQNVFSVAIENRNKWDSCGLSTWEDKIEESTRQACKKSGDENEHNDCTEPLQKMWTKYPSSLFVPLSPRGKMVSQPHGCYLRTAPVLNAWPYSLRKWQPTPVFLLWKSHEQRSLAGYSPWGCKESDTTERLSTLEPELEIFQLCQSAAWESLKNIRLVVLVSPLVSLQPYLWAGLPLSPLLLVRDTEPALHVLIPPPSGLLHQN